MEYNKDKKSDDILEKLVHINRITKVVKGGRRFGFSALVVVGNQAGRIGIAHAKAKQVPDAIKKAKKMEKSSLIGEILAKRAKEKNISKVYFDRGEYKYHGRVKTFAETLRKNGLEF